MPVRRVQSICSVFQNHNGLARELIDYLSIDACQASCHGRESIGAVSAQQNVSQRSSSLCVESTELNQTIISYNCDSTVFHRYRGRACQSTRLGMGQGLDVQRWDGAEGTSARDPTEFEPSTLLFVLVQKTRWWKSGHGLENWDESGAWFLWCYPLFCQLYAHLWVDMNEKAGGSLGRRLRWASDLQHVSHHLLLACITLTGLYARRHASRHNCYSWEHQPWC